MLSLSIPVPLEIMPRKGFGEDSVFSEVLRKQDPD
jgi:hypothetical protein